jgi:peptidyl-dipeptidase A
MRKILIILVIIVVGGGCLDQKKQAESIFRHYLDRKTGLIRNYFMEMSLAYYNASVSGKESDYKKLMDLELDFSRSNRNMPENFSPDNFSTITKNVFTNEEDFELLQKLKNSGLITDTLLYRQLIYLYHSFLSSQIESDKYKKLLERESKLSHTLSTVKLELNGKVYNATKIDSVRKSTSSSQVLENIARSYQEMGKAIAPDIIKLVKDRNEIAATFGFPDYYHLLLEEKDQSPQKIQSLISEIELKTRDQFFEVKKIIDKKLAKRFGISNEQLRPWHYNDSRTSYLPKHFITKLDSLLSPTDPIKRTSDFFAGIGLPIQDIIDKSELRKCKTDATIIIDFKNDIRMIGGITNTFDGLSKILHEGGHASHYKNISDNLPYLLKGPSLFISEGIASYFANLATDSLWLSKEISSNEKTKRQIALFCRHFRQVDQLFKIRRQMVFAEFEREIYTSPDQDLDLLWHQLNLKYLGINYPEEKGTCFWATNKYLASLSCNIQSYVVADVFAAQLKHAVDDQVLNKKNISIQNNKAVGKYLIDKLYQYGDLYPWEELVEKATGEPLNSAYFVNELVGNDRENQE